MTESTVTEIEKTNESDFDSAWKEVIETLFEPFITYFFPKIQKAIDFAKPIEILKDDLRQIDPDNKLGKRIADALIKVHLKGKRRKFFWLLIHIEIDGNPRAQFMERMFVYYYRIYDRFHEKGIDIISLGILTDEEKNVKPNKFKVNCLGFKLNMTIPIVKITDYKWNEKKKLELETSTNPMAMVVRAQLKSIEIKGSDSERRYAAKCELLRECRRQNYGCDPTRTLFKFIGWSIRLPEELERKLVQEINRLEEDTKMQYIPLWEKKAWDEGEANGFKRGIEKGAETGAENEKMSIAKRLLQNGLAIDIIATATNIPVEDLKKLSVEMKNPQSIH